MHFTTSWAIPGSPSVLFAPPTGPAACYVVGGPRLVRGGRSYLPGDHFRACMANNFTLIAVPPLI